MAFVAIVGLIVMSALVALLYAPDKSREDLAAKYDGEYRTVAQVRLRIRDTGPRKGPTVVLLHGFGASLDTWEPWAKSLSARYRVVRFDLPGFGLTGPEPAGDYSDKRGIEIVTGLLDQLGVSRANLIGNSLGGRIAWMFAATHPERVQSLVLISPDGFASPGFEYGKVPETPFVMKALPYVMPRSMLQANLAAAYADPRKLSEQTLDRYHDMMLAPGVRQAILSRMGQTVLQDPRPILATISTPTLLLWGQKDGMIPVGNAKDYLAFLQNAKVVRLPDLGHVPFEEDPAGSLPPVAAFLAESNP